MQQVVQCHKTFSQNNSRLSQSKLDCWTVLQKQKVARLVAGASYDPTPVSYTRKNSCRIEH